MALTRVFIATVLVLSALACSGRPHAPLGPPPEYEPPERALPTPPASADAGAGGSEASR
jgi:hypothetical protein